MKIAYANACAGYVLVFLALFQVGGSKEVAPGLAGDSSVEVKAITIDATAASRSPYSIPVMDAAGLSVYYRRMESPEGAGPSRRESFLCSRRLNAEAESLLAKGLGSAVSCPSISATGDVIAIERLLTEAESPSYSDVEIMLVRQSSSSVLQVTGANGTVSKGLYAPQVSSDGKWIAFLSENADIVTADSNVASDVFIAAISGGRAECISVAADGHPSNGASFLSPGALSTDGCKAVFLSTATNLPDSPGPSGVVYIRDRKLKKTSVLRLQGAFSAAVCTGAKMGPAGDMIAVEVRAPVSLPFDGQETVLLRTANGSTQLDLRDLATAADPAYVIGECSESAFSADGRHLVMRAIVASSEDARENQFTTSCALVVIDIPARRAAIWKGNKGSEVPNSICFGPCISSGGRVVAFLSRASNLLGNQAADGFGLYLMTRKAP